MEKSLIPHPDPKAGAPLPPAITIEIPANYLQQQQQGTAAAGEEEASVPLSQYLWLIWRSKWKISAFMSFAVIATAVISARLTPIYESTAVIDVDRRAPTGIVGQESQMINAVNDADQFIATQVKLIQSDSVLRPVVRKFNPEPATTPSVLEQKPIQTVSEEEAPVILKKLRVTRPPNTFILQIAYRNRDPHLAADVANAIARSYVEHTWTIRYRASAGLSKFMEKQLEELKAKMEKSSAALAAFEREFSFINPEEKTSILSGRLIQLNTEYTSAQADRVRKEAAYNSVKSGSMESAFVSSQGESLKKLQERFNEAQEKFAQVKTEFGVNHPDYRQAASRVVELQNQIDSTRKNIAQRSLVEYSEAVNREQMIQKALAETKADFDHLNSRSFEYKALKQEADGDKKLYEELITKIRESEINAGFQNSSIRLADPALPGRKAVFPNIPLNVVLAFLFSGILAVGAVILADTLDNTVHDPDQVVRMGSQVIGSLPVVRAWKQAKAPVVLPGVNALPAANGTSTSLITAAGSAQNGHRRGSRLETAYDEAVRSIRESILLSDIDHPVRTVLITSATPREGKTTFASNLAMVHSQQNTKTLMIDADMRRPSAHIRFGLENNAGLADVIRDDKNWRDLLQPVPGNPYLDFLAAGPASLRAYDLLGLSLERILDNARREYGLIVIDAPPLLGFAEPLKAASLADGVVVVASSAATKRAALESVLTALRRVKARVIGVVLNNVDQKHSHKYYYGSYYGYYGKYYSHYYGSERQS